MILKAFSSRHSMSIYDIDEPFAEIIDEDEIYSFIGGFDFHDEDTEEIIATVRGIFFDEDKILNEDEDIVALADALDGDVMGAMSVLTKSKIHNQELNDEKAMLPLFSCYIQRIYVYPKFRGSGFARYIFENLEAICLHSFNTPIHSFVIYPKPQQPDVNENWDNMPDKDDMILKRMIGVLKKAGYKQIGKSGYYALNCAIDK